jgi:hypothetical protein
VHAAAANPTAAAYFPAIGIPTWQIAVASGAGVIFASYLYADRLKSRGHTPGQKQVLEFAYALLGVAAVATIVGLLFIAGKVALAK